MAKKKTTVITKPKVKVAERILFDDILVESGKTGATTKIFINGKQITNACVLDFHAEARGLNTLTLKVYPNIIAIQGDAIVKSVEVNPVKTKKTNKGIK